MTAVLLNNLTWQELARLGTQEALAEIGRRVIHAPDCISEKVHDDTCEYLEELREVWDEIDRAPGLPSNYEDIYDAGYQACMDEYPLMDYLQRRVSRYLARITTKLFHVKH